MIDKTELWIVMIGLGAGSYALRFAFLGLVGDRPLPDWLRRHLRYTAVAILPALIGPLVVYSGPNGETDPARLMAAMVTLGVGIYSKNVLAAIAAGAVTLTALVYGLG